ncbi:hypothetical protein PIROE2DRAFT_20632 [Piromyces sp. E2]|nr:hypothetical protein PIROE2DRAFT_20632 [Piromyces sp. E2]|eukprot:OUM63741.1 hypothetical protein PIROE2DRAFT_20632 [Piromyces sp. E2]
MKIKFFGIALSSIIAFANAKQHYFNVVSILGEGSKLGVKYGNVVQPLTPSPFPLFSGVIEADNINDYHYVSLDINNMVIDEEIIQRTYSDANANLNEVYNRTNKNVKVTNLPRPFEKNMFSMKTKKYKPFPKDTIYNIYASCDENQYSELVNTPFLGQKINEHEANCTISIISPNSKFESEGSFHVIGFGSRKFKKLSFGMKFEKKFLGRKAIKLRAMANDDSLVRELLASEVFTAAGVPVQEGTYARVFINGETFGLYSMIDSFNDRWIGAYIHGNEKAKIGISYKLCSNHPMGPYANLRLIEDDGSVYDSYTYLLDEYEKKDIAKDDLQAQFAPLINFTRLFDQWVNTYGNDQSQVAIDELKKFLNIESLLRLMAVETLIMAIDNFWLAISNTALYYNPERNNYQFIPFDFDQAMEGTHSSGLIVQDSASAMRDCLHWADSPESPADHYFTDNLMSHPQIKERYDVILAVITREIFDPKYLTPYIQSLAELIGEDVEWAFNMVDNLGISYNGRVGQFTLQDFQENISYDKTNYNLEERLNEPSLVLSEFIDIRSDSCRAYTANVNTSNNQNISDDYDVKEIEESPESKLDAKSSATSSMKKLSLLFVFAQIILLLL